MRLSRTVFKILSLIFQKLKTSHDSDAQFVSVAGTCCDQHAHQIWSLWLKPFQRYVKGTKSLKWVTWRGHAHFRDILSSVGCDLLCSTHILSLKCLRLPATKKWRATPNVKILVLSHPLGDLGVTYTVHLWLAGKRVIDFLLVLIEFFLLALMAAALVSEICRNQRFLKGWVTLSANVW